MNGHKLTPKLCTVTLPNTVKPVGDAVTMDGSTVKAAVWLPVTLTTPGYENVSLTVKDADNADVTLTDGTFIMPNSDVTVTGTMTPIVYTISYDLCGGTLTAANPATYTIESETFTLNNPAITGIDFLGWTGTDLDDPTTTVTIAQGSIGNRTYKANFDAVILQDGTAYTLTGDAVVKAATYIKTTDRKDKYHAWLVPFDYTLTEDDLDAFTFYKINMIANSPSPSQEATDEVWVFLKKLNKGAVLHGNMPYVYKPKAEVTDYAFTTPNATLKAKDTGIILDTRTAEDIYSFYATYDQYTTATTADPFYYVGIDGSLSVGTAVSVGPLRWIIRKESKFGNTTSYAREMHFFDGEATGINEELRMKNEEFAAAQWYTIDGRKLDGKPTTKGVYVVNGRKVVIK